MKQEPALCTSAPVVGFKVPGTEQVTATAFMHMESVMLSFMVFGVRMAGLCTCSVIVALGVGTCAVKTSAMWLFPMANTIVWLHFTDIMREPVKPLWQSYLYFGISILIVFVVNLVVAVKSDFITTGEH